MKRLVEDKMANIIYYIIRCFCILLTVSLGVFGVIPSLIGDTQWEATRKAITPALAIVLIVTLFFSGLFLAIPQNIAIKVLDYVANPKRWLLRIKHLCYVVKRWYDITKANRSRK